MFRVAVVGNTQEIANEGCSWLVSNEKENGFFEKSYEISDKKTTIFAFPYWKEKIKDMPVAEVIAIICKESPNLDSFKWAIDQYVKVPIKIVLYDGGAKDSAKEAEWSLIPIQKEDPKKFVEKILEKDAELDKEFPNKYSALKEVMPKLKTMSCCWVKWPNT